MTTGPTRVVLDERTIEQFRTDGFALVRDAFDPGPLSSEVDEALATGLRSDAGVNRGSGGVGFRAVIMMCERTPASLGLLDALVTPASQLLGRPVLPMRAKGTRYLGPSGWHSDSELAIPSMGCVAYLERLDAASGALRVVPGSHHTDGAPSTVDGVVLATAPGDLVVFDEHLTHGSVGGGVRRQWRVDFIADPYDDGEEAQVRASYARLFDVGWDGGDDVDRYPSYGPFWQARNRPWNGRLRELGVYDLAATHAAAVRARRT